MIRHEVERWGLLWRSHNRLNGRTEHLIFQHGLPLLFLTRRQARQHAVEFYSYVKRPDLRAEPHGWRMPVPVRVKISVVRAGK